MKFRINDVLCVDGGMYRVVGRITYLNSADGCKWDEYRLFAETDKSEHWLSVDDTYKEYSIWKMARNPDRTGYHQVDQGTEVVISCAGNVDVETGDRAFFVEYEDETEEKIISDEIWDDGKETSVGYYLDEDEFWLVDSPGGSSVFFGMHGASNKKGSALIFSIVALIFLVPMLGTLLGNLHFTTTIAKYLDKSDRYTYVTSITGNEKQNAKVYKADNMTIDAVAKDIIVAIEGDTEYVRQDDAETEGTIAILTSKEYCLIYASLEDEVLVQISNRKYAYTTDDDPYHSTARTRHYYRSFYYSSGYSSDSTNYSSYVSPYSSYDGDSVSFSGVDTYSSYSNSIRQSSIASRQSSSGGLSSGK